MKPTSNYKQQIINYFDHAEFDYSLVWNLRKSQAMHYGYWDKSVNNLHEALKREDEILAQMVNIKRGDRVLDAGCGVGGSAIYLAQKYGCHVTGITLSKRQVETAKKNAKKSGVSDKTEFLAMDFEKTTFANNEFNVVWGIESICYADSKKRFSKEAYRLLKKGGQLIIADGFATKNKYETEAEEKIISKSNSGWKLKSIETADKFKLFLKQSGFKKISFSDITDYVMPSSKRLYRMSAPALPLGKITQLLKIRNEYQTGNVEAGYYQYKGLVKGMWKYGILQAYKN